jgi:ubiquinone/menaquinone biosynthesis C-methylase UbiE
MIALGDAVTRRTVESLVRYYSEAGPDFAAWSPKFNMHFGYWVWGVNPFNREAMLDRTNAEVARRLDLDEKPQHVVDLGCGLGATARFLTRLCPQVRVTGVTIVPWQVERARRLSSEAVEFVEEDYTATSFATATFDAAYALESSCHAPGRDKAAFIREAHRILKPGARLVVVDGFRKLDTPMCALVRRAYETMCRCYVLEQVAHLESFLRCMEECGFDDIQVEDASWRAAPSVAHVPWVSLRFLLREARHGLTEQRWNNAVAPVVMALLGMARRRFGYYYIIGRKRV